MVTAVPDLLQFLAGDMIDVDTHEMMPAQSWVAEFGAVAKPIVDGLYRSVPPNGGDPNCLNVPGFVADDQTIDASTIWAVKGPRAPGAADMTRREKVLDMMGVSRGLVYPSSVGLKAVMLRTGTNAAGAIDMIGDNSTLDLYIEELFSAHNEWAIRTQKSSERMNFAGLLAGSSPDGVLRNAKYLVENGIRTVLLMSTELLGGLSPAHDDLDPVWDYLSENDIAATMHLGDHGGLLKTLKWGDAPFFEGYRKGLEFDLDPWSSSVAHLGAQNYVATMVIGGVFERHPRLRLGVVEYGAYWIGPLANLLDMWHKNGGVVKRDSIQTHLPELPSTYIKRNVRVSAFDFEEVDKYIEMYDLEDVLCYASDYPHVEGGKGAMERFARKLERLGPDVMRKFFVTNGEWIVPRVRVKASAPTS
jgi:predicted TIM-barrel fold metal-dependent hydrolase